jgi:indolepyruvate ferredoxin oxidoreductase alpha subunit
MDVLADANEILEGLGVHFENSANEATAAATLAASVNYPLRGAVTFKSVVGVNVASDALSNLASGGVTGGALVIIGEDYGEGSSIMQERVHPFAQKSQIWLLDPRPNLPSIVNAVKKGFELSGGDQHAGDARSAHPRLPRARPFRDERQRAAVLHLARRDGEPARQTDRIVLPPASYLHEKEKVEKRWPAAVKFIEENKLNEFFDGDLTDIGIVMQGGMYNTTLRALELCGLADALGHSRVPLYVMNVTYPLVDRELIRFAEGKRAILIVEEGQPEFLELAINTIFRRTTSRPVSKARECCRWRANTPAAWCATA